MDIFYERYRWFFPPSPAKPILLEYYFNCTTFPPNGYNYFWIILLVAAVVSHTKLHKPDKMIKSIVWEIPLNFHISLKFPNMGFA
ncbi:hypothetical protein VNO77_39627 [Canavalia gladiata]|uniref:Uncharacterized protein n=1 Tax=Canavalia gladiata TaxID=3824 RepID=A0AAN9K0J7_CANGL